MTTHFEATAAPECAYPGRTCPARFQPGAHVFEVKDTRRDSRWLALRSRDPISLRPAPVRARLVWFQARALPGSLRLGFHGWSSCSSCCLETAGPQGKSVQSRSAEGSKVGTKASSNRCRKLMNSKQVKKSTGSSKKGSSSKRTGMIQCLHVSHTVFEMVPEWRSRQGRCEACRAAGCGCGNAVC